MAYADVGENKTIIVHTATQELTYPQNTIATALGVPENKVCFVYINYKYSIE